MSAFVHYTGRFLVIGRGKVAVIAGKLPRTPKTRDKQPTMTDGEMRYFSISRYINGPDPTDWLRIAIPSGNWGTLNDEDIVTKSEGPGAGWYMVMYSREEDRPGNATEANGVTWDNWHDHAQQHMVIRWMGIPPEWDSPWFPAPWHVPLSQSEYCEPGWDPSLIFHNNRSGMMGDYQPVVHYMTTEQFEALGDNLDPTNLPGATDWHCLSDEFNCPDDLEPGLDKLYGHETAFPWTE